MGDLMRQQLQVLGRLPGPEPDVAPVRESSGAQGARGALGREVPVDPHSRFVEKAIAELPEVDDVFVYGIPAASGAPGERDVVAAIVYTEGGSEDPEASNVFSE